MNQLTAATAMQIIAVTQMPVHPACVQISPDAALPMDWGYRVPFGMLYANNPSDAMKEFASLIEKAV